MSARLKAPFPYFGGKSGAADIIWRAFGDVYSYVEPFAGSCAVLLARPSTHKRRYETVNDADGLLANFWRALKLAPNEVVEHADWPVNEADMFARHAWLIGQRDGLTKALKADPEWFDPKAAGWWAWGAVAWIGTGWCVKASDQLPRLGGRRRDGRTLALIRECAQRVSGVAVACGDWSRVMGRSTLLVDTANDGAMTGVLFDPPYLTANKQAYAVDAAVAEDVREWALANADNPRLRIALCGYTDEHDMPGWNAVEWSAERAGGYRNQSGRSAGAAGSQEVIWLSPHCLGDGGQMGLFAANDDREATP